VDDPEKYGETELEEPQKALGPKEEEGCSVWSSLSQLSAPQNYVYTASNDMTIIG
jgi:hypothetical protein